VTASAAAVSVQGVGILAGSGDLPRMLVEACRAEGRDPFVVAFNGFTDPSLVTGTRHVWVDIAAVGKTFQQLRQAGCRDVVFAGQMRRPALSSLRPDARGLLVLAKVAAAGGDDAVLRVLVKELESEGFRVIGADDLLRGLLAPAGALGGLAPDESHRADIRRGIAVARALGSVDVGHSVVVQQGIVLGVEAIEGTDALLRRCADLRREGRGGVLVKLKKVEQDRRVDLPVIGPDTISGARAAGLAGIAVEAGGTLVMRRADVAAAAAAANLFVYGLSEAELS
jgi:DUF1009 family protein